MKAWAQVREFLRPPVLQDRRATVAAATTYAVGVTAAIAAVAWMVLWLFLIENAPFGLISTTTVVLCGLAAVVLVRRKRPRAAGWLLVGMLWLVITAALLATGDVQGRMFGRYLVIIVVAGLVLGGRAAFATALLSCGVGAWLALGPDGASSSLPTSEEAALSKWAGQSLLFFVVAALLSFARNRIEWALDTADEKESALIQRERDLESSRERFRVLTRSSKDLVTETDDAGIFFYASPNHEEVLGYPPGELIGKSLLEYVHPADRGAVASRMEQVVTSTDAAYEMAFRFLHRDGSWRQLESAGSTFRADDGTVHGVTVTRDVTERRALEDRLRHSQKLEAVALLAGGIAHDFNNLLSVITGYSELLMKRDERSSEGNAAIREIHEAGVRGAGLTRQLLAFSGRQVLRPRLLDPNQVLLALQHLLSRLLGEDVEMATSLGPGELRVLADPSQLEQIVVNLAVNARDAMPGGGHLRIETRVYRGEPAAATRADGAPGGEWVVLAVGDDGVGMESETMARIFEPYFTTKDPGKGTGLGLPTVHGIVEQSGGWIEVDSEPGAGTEFRIYLPRAGDAPAEERATAPTKELSQRGSETVLVVEDDAALRRLVTWTLEKDGYTVLAARNGSEALDLASDHRGPIDLLLGDVVMPQMGGGELRDQLVHARPELRVLFMSGYSDHASVARASLAPEDPLLEKPFNPEQLTQKVREVLEAPSTE
jgi:PAS domain S-box-containing protein